MKINMIENMVETAEKRPLARAIVDNGRVITFAELNTTSRLVGCSLMKATNNQTRRPVGVFIAKSIESVAADLGILYSGNAYLNLDVKTPLHRIANILDLVQPIAVLTTKKYVSQISQIYPMERIVIIDYAADSRDTGSKLTTLDNQWQKTIDTDMMCIITTSGSTGTPKAVALNHRSFFDYVNWAIDTIGLRDDEVFASLAPIVFDHFSFELCFMITTGSTMVIIPDSFAAFPARLLQYMQEEHITYLFWVPSIMVNIANMDLLSRIPLPDLRMVWFAGEVFPTKHFNYWRRNLPYAKFVNLYGPTEITVDCTYYVVERELSDDEPIPIGYPCRNTDVIVLNEETEIASIGEEGELCVRGTSLAMGYYNNPEKTAEVFVQNPLSLHYPEIIYRTGDIVETNDRGELVFRGRRDTLIKHMGYRIELTEIEHVIVNTLGLVKNACVVYNQSRKEIVLYYEADSDVDIAEVRKAIGSALPRYMIPSVYVRMSEFPRNANGKIDRLRLGEISADER